MFRATLSFEGAAAAVADQGQVPGDFMMPPSPKIPKTRSFFVEGVVYTTGRVLGRGGSAKVYEVVAPDGQHFALKRCVHRSPALPHRVWGEVINLTGLNSPTPPPPHTHTQTHTHTPFALLVPN